jgi:hypothetical protein
MHQFKRLGRMMAIASLSLATLGFNSGVALAQSGSVGQHVDNGVQCFMSQMLVNSPQVYAFDATTAVDTQSVFWTSEVWRLDEATGQYVLAAEYGEWMEKIVDDGTQSSYITIGGQQTFDIFQSGTYRAAIRYQWAATATAPAGEAYEWVGQYFLTDWGWYLGTSLPAVDACTVAII